MPRATRHDRRIYCCAPIDAEDQRKPRLIRASHPNHARRQPVEESQAQKEIL